MQIDAQGIFFRESDVIPGCSDCDFMETKEYDIPSKHLPRIFMLSGLGEDPLRDTSDDGGWSMV